jgi:ribosome biogenesis protein MAK21
MVLDGKIGTAAQLAKAQADKAAEAAAKRKKGEAAKARAAEEARQKAAAAAAASSQQGSGEMDGRMLSALITGVRRAFPYVPADEVEPLIEAHADALFRLVHARSFSVATQALLLLFQLMSSRSTVSDRFYRALYAVLGSSELYRSTKAPMFLSLLFKAIKADVSAKRTAAFAKRLLQVAQEAPAHFACGCLLLTSELLKVGMHCWTAQPFVRVMYC